MNLLENFQKDRHGALNEEIGINPPVFSETWSASFSQSLETFSRVVVGLLASDLQGCFVAPLLPLELMSLILITFFNYKTVPSTPLN